MFDWFLVPLGWVLKQLSYLCGGSFAAGVFLFTVIVNCLMIPLSIKTQKSSVGQARIKPKLDALKEKYGDDRQKFATEQQKLMQEENISMSGGCLPMLIRFPILLGVYAVIQSPLTYLGGVSKELVATATNAYTTLHPDAAKSYLEPLILGSINKGEITFAGIDGIKKAMSNFDFSFLGIDLTTKPEFNIDIINKFDINWLIPILAFATAMLSSIVSMSMQKKTNPDAPSMSGLLLTMPLISLIIGFTVSCAAGFYWACSSFIACIIQVFVSYFYGPNRMIAKAQEKELYDKYKEEQKTIVATQGDTVE
ncbi:MAG: YidC/Oxa1 family membrane protein insertase [Oscillospiraceae bacterium]|nr:YidC/Oxa1 family membrane protein insertase [Candidatus Equicaccousia limihippi]